MKKMNTRRGEGYVDVCVGIVAFVMFLSTALNIFACLNLKTEMDAAAQTVLELACAEGCTDSETLRGLIAEYCDRELTVSVAAETEGPVQLGEPIEVSVSKKTALSFAGIRFPLELSCQRRGLSKRYWKTV